MGTTTFYLRHNDLGCSLSRMSKEEVANFDKLSPYGKNNHYLGWTTPCELHNGNVYLLVFWQGKLMRLEQAAEALKNKYYNKYDGKTLRKYEWTVLKSYILREVEHLDSIFRRSLRKRKKEKNDG